MCLLASDFLSSSALSEPFAGNVPDLELRAKLHITPAAGLL